MKKHLKTLALAFCIVLASCSEDETSTANNVDDQAVEEQEQTPIEANTIADNVVINGATQNTGTPPVPNEAISLDVSSSSTTALLGEGFEVEIASDGNLVGAYLQFKSNDGTVSDSYYDIDLNANASNKGLQKGLKLSKRNAKSTLKEEETTLDVDFNSTIEPGTFCYVICVYDNEGNISAPQEVCVTVEGWGGNNDIVGNWEATKEQTINDNGTSEFIVGERDDCYEETILCDNMDEIMVSLCYVQDYGLMEISADGTFSLDFKSTQDVLDYDTTRMQCQGVIEASEYRFQVDGYWAYVSEESRLTLVGYDFNILEDGDTEIETLPSGSGELVFDGQAELIGNELIITETYEDFEFEETYKIFFEKQ